MARHMGRGRGAKMRRRPAGSRKGAHVVEGVLHVRRRDSATITTDEGTFTVARGGIREGMNGDLVRASLVRRGPGEPQAFIQSVIRRETRTFLGSYSVVSPLGVVVPLDERIKHDFFVLPEDASTQRLGVEEGDIVAARILTYPSRKEAGVVTIDRRIGSSSELNLDIEALIASYDLPVAFPEPALEEARRIRVDVPAALERDPVRRDLRERFCFTIDPADARDFDDAVCASRTDDGGYEVGVHIADVSYYVPWESSLDLEARQRTCSVYLVDRVLPMLPEELSNEACSLKPGEDRLCMSVVMRLNSAGEVVDAEAFPSAIRSRARLSYDTADEVLRGEEPSGDFPTGETGETLREMLAVLDEVARRRGEVRTKRGAIDFAGVEPKVVLDETGKPVGVQVRTRTAATQLIEEAMLIANESVAQMLVEADQTAAFRVHEQPSPDTLRTTLPALHEMDLAKGEAGERLAAGDPFAIRAVLEQAAGTNAEFLANTLLLRAQKKAIYLPHNDGHYALGAKAYCHFTSPIRRYPDVVVHRALKALLYNTRESKEQRSCAKILPAICERCSERERSADAAGRASQKVKMAEFYSDKVGESFSGIVVGVERFGLFVMLDDTCAEGLLAVRDLGEEWFAYDEERLTLTGESTGKVWRPGMRVAVRVSATNPSRGQIDFQLAKPQK